ncbi:MAG: hypothetical protein FWH23_01325 [Bacteroidales bacterium]|nr:hypothetical protein [Bacteroidales bacterium]
MRKIAIILIVLALIASSCGNRQSKTVNDNAVEISHENDNNTHELDNGRNKQIFYRILDNTIYTYQKFVIENRELVLNCLDMDFYGYHISNIKEQGDTIITMTFDKIIGDVYDYIEERRLILYDSPLPNPIKKMTLHKDRSTFIWKIFENENNKPYKFLVIDSIDVEKSGYILDTVNHWLDDIE